MAQRRHRTTLEINVDDRQIRGLDKSLARAFDDSTIQSFERSIERLSRTIEGLTTNLDRAGAASRSAGGGGPASSRAGSAAGRARDDRGRFGASSSTSEAMLSRLVTGQSRRFMQRMGMGLYRGVGQLGAGMVQGEGATETALGALPLGGVLAGAVSAARGYQQQYIAQQTAIAQASAALGGSGVGGLSRLRRYGYGLDAGQAAGAAAGYARSAGLMGGDLSTGLIEAFARNENALGISGGGSGLINALNVGRGRGNTVGDPAAITSALSAGMQAGFRDARLGEFLETISSTLESARRQGINLNQGQMQGMISGLSSLGDGFRAEQAAEFARAVQRGLAGFRPGNDATTIALMRAAGYGQDGMGWFDAQERIQSNPADVLRNLLSQTRDRFGGGDGGTERVMYGLRQILPRLGVDPSIQQLRRLASGDVSAIEELTGANPDNEAALSGRARRVTAQFGTATTEARMRNAGAAIGGRVNRSMNTIRVQEMRLAGVTIPAIASGVAQLVTYAGQLANAFQSEGPGGLINKILEIVQELVTQGVEALRNGIGEALGLGPVDEDERRAREQLFDDPIRTIGEAFEGLVDLATGEVGPLSSRLPAAQRGATGDDVGPTDSAAEAMRAAARNLVHGADQIDAMTQNSGAEYAV